MSVSIKKKVTERINSINTHISTSCSKVADYQSRILELSNNFYPENLRRIASTPLIPIIEQSVDYVVEIKKFLGNSKVSINMTNIKDFQNKLDQCLKDVERDAKKHCEELTEAQKDYGIVYQSFEETSRIVNTQGSTDRRAALNQIFNDLISNETINFLNGKEWKTFRERLGRFYNELYSLRVSYDASENTSITPLEQAYRTLGIPQTASDEQVKGVYRALMRACHPDSNPQGGGGDMDSRVKRSQEVNAAYNLIRRDRGI